MQSTIATHPVSIIPVNVGLNEQLKVCNDDNPVRLSTPTIPEVSALIFVNAVHPVNVAEVIPGLSEQFMSFNDVQPVTFTDVRFIFASHASVTRFVNPLTSNAPVISHVLAFSVTRAAHPVSVSVVSDAFEEQLSVVRDVQLEQSIEVREFE